MENVEHRIAVVSDTHDLLRPMVIENLKGCDAILHAGDISSSPEILEELQKIASVHAVRGNADEGWGRVLPLVFEMELHGVRFLMAHKKKDIPKDAKADIIICGHSHKYREKKENGVLYLNPGSCGPRKITQPITMAVIEIGNTDFRVRKIEISHGEERSTKLAVGVTPELIKKICGDTDRGMGVERIAKKRHIDTETADRIVRLYLTHPGVTPDGIMEKMGL